MIDEGVALILNDGTSKPVGWASNFIKFYPMMPTTEYIKTCLFAISGNDAKFSYDFFKSATLHVFLKGTFLIQR